MKTWKYLTIFLSALFLYLLISGCESEIPRSDLSMAEMEQFYLANQADFNAIQKLILPMFDYESDLSQGRTNRRTIRIARPDHETDNPDGTSEEALIFSSELSIPEAERLALLQAAEPLFDRTPILCIFANDHEVYFYYYEKWGVEHFVAYREDGMIPRGSFGNIQDSKQIDENWYAVTAHD